MTSFENSYNKNILRIIDQYSYKFYLVHPNKEIDCKCINFDTKEPDSACKYCLSTGKRITIKSIKGAHQETAIPSTARNLEDIVIARNYYVPYKYKVSKDDLIVDDEDVFTVYAVQDEISFHGEKLFQKCLTYSKKIESIVLIKNFKEIMGGINVKNKTIKH